MKHFTGLVVVLSYLAVPAAAFASSFTFVFNCQIAQTNNDVCVPGGPYGTLTLTDSLVDSNRVDIDLTIVPPANFGQPLEQLYLNFADPFLNNHQFFLVGQNTAAGIFNDTTPYQGLTVGQVASYTPSNLEFGQFAFDLNPNPASGLQTFSGSLALYDLIADDPVDLDALDFFYLTVPTATSPGAPPLYAGYRTNNSVCPGDTGTCPEFWAGSTTTAVPAPEPASLLLLGTGLLGFAARLRRTARKASPASPGVQRVSR